MPDLRERQYSGVESGILVAWKKEGFTCKCALLEIRNLDGQSNSGHSNDSVEGLELLTRVLKRRSREKVLAVLPGSP